MKSLNIHKMIEDSVATGEPVTESFMLGARISDEEQSPVIDTQPISTSETEEKPGSRWDSRLPATTHRFGEVTPCAPASKFCFPSPSFMPSSVDKPRITPDVCKLVDKVDAAQLPSDLVSDSNRRFFFALIEFVFSMFIDECRILFFEKLGCGTAQAWDYVRRMKSASVTESVGIIDLAIKIFGRSRCKAALIVGYLLGLRPEYCFRTFPVKSVLGSIIPVHNSQIKELIPKQLVVDGRLYLLKSIDYQNDYRGMKEQAVCLYMDKACSENKFFLIANRVEKDGSYVLEIGTTPVPARLYSCAEMAIHENTTIIIFMDMSVAMEFRRIARESSLLEREGIIISGYFGDSGAFEVLELNDLPGHRVVLVPGFNQESFVSALKFAERCEKAGVTNVGIYQHPVIVSDALDCVNSSGRNQWKDMLMENAVRLKDVELPSKFARSVCEKSLTRSDFAKWLISVGLVASADTQKDNDLGEEDDIQFVRLSDIPEEDANVSEPITLESIFNHEDATFLWAPTDAGKSWGALNFGIGLATGTEAFGIPARCPHGVGIMDGEISTRKKNKHVRQLLHDRPELVSLAKNNLHILPPSGKLKRFNEEFADRLAPKLHKLNIDVLILDNLQALDPDSGQFNAKDLMAFVRRMKLQGIAVFIIHHSDKEGKNYKGPTTLVDLSQTVFRGEGVDEVRKLVLDDPDKTHVLEACDEGGPVLRLTITKGKIGGMKGKSVIYHLPIDGVWTHLEGDLVPTIDLDPLPAIVSAESEENSAIPVPEDKSTIHDLTPDEEKVCVALKGRNYKRAELETLTGFKTDKLGGILRRLVARGLVTKAGVGKATCYKCG